MVAILQSPISGYFLTPFLAARAIKQHFRRTVKKYMDSSIFAKHYITRTDPVRKVELMESAQRSNMGRSYIAFIYNVRKKSYQSNILFPKTET